MKKLILITALICTGCASTCTNYAKVGAGYKFRETKIVGETYKESPLSARLEVGKNCNSYTYGVSHHSQWLVGKPIDNKTEYAKTEVFVDYVIEF